MGAGASFALENENFAPFIDKDTLIDLIGNISDLSKPEKDAIILKCKFQEVLY
jgi:hypothetical protein